MAKNEKHLILILDYLSEMNELGPVARDEAVEECKGDITPLIPALLRIGVAPQKVADAVGRVVASPIFPHSIKDRYSTDVPSIIPNPLIVTHDWVFCDNGIAYIKNFFDQKVFSEIHDRLEKEAQTGGAPADMVDYGVIDPSRLQKLVEATTLSSDPAPEAGAEKKQENDLWALNELNQYLNEAAALNASDIHFEAENKVAVMRMRIDGDLRRIKTYPYENYLRIANVILSKGSKGQAGSYSETVDDRFVHTLPGGRKIKFRVMMAPVTLGEDPEVKPGFVLRLLGNNTSAVLLNQLGLPSDDANPQYQMMRMFCERKNGIILVSGPTGSGKTTTLTALQQEMIRMYPNKKYWTVEDPVEISLNGVQQVQVNEKANVNFARCLKSFLRGDPDVILVGEIRDHEVASLALTAAITGHLVFSTIHTNSSVEAISRLINIECDPFIIGSALKAVTAQRLVKKVCDHCSKEARWGELVDGTHESLQRSGDHMYKIRYKIAAEERYKTLPEYPSNDTVVRIANPDGCPKCKNKGYQGRLLCSEIFMVTPAVSKMITERQSISTIRRHAIEVDGFLDLWSHGMSLLTNGFTTFDELIQALGDREAL